MFIPCITKYKFRKVIGKEIKKNIEIRKYYDGWGSRLYTFPSNAMKY